MRCKRRPGGASASAFRRCALGALVSVIACTELESRDDFFGYDASVLATSPFNRPHDGGSSEPSAIAGCLPTGDRPALILGQAGEPMELDQDTAWTCRFNYVLQSPLVVTPGATLAIGPDTRISSGRSVFILIQRGARLLAEGARDAPVVFTSSQPIGQRAPGDWRGLMLAGNAPSHATNGLIPSTLNDARASFGGGPEGDAQHDCGSLRYVRVEFAGAATDEESTPLSAVSLAGCGAATQVDYLQVHRATDGLGLFGGTVAIKHVVVSNNGFGDAIEWTGGYTGAMQYVVAQSAGAAAALKGSNADSDPGLAPVSHPSIYNATIVGIRPAIPSGNHFGLLLQLGSSATLKNSIVTNFDDAAIDLRSAPTLAAVSSAHISHLLLHDNGPNGTTHFTLAAARLTDQTSRDRDPGLKAAARRENPDFRPTQAAVSSDIAATRAGFDPAATYRGAVPFQGDDWTLGWTRYPLD